jgi:hypothetical protein
MDADVDANVVAGVLRVTGRDSLADAIAWLAEELPMPEGTDWSWLLRVLVDLVDDDEASCRALRRVVREVTRSEMDSSRVLFDTQDLPAPQRFADALGELLQRSEDATLAGITPRSLQRAQLANPAAIETLCLVVGVTYRDARDWFACGSDAWSLEQIEQLLRYCNDLVGGQIRPLTPDTVPARAVEFVVYGEDGWQLPERLRQRGVPYELLLAQRAVGSPWSAHKNKTSNRLSSATAGFLCSLLAERGVDFCRATTVGGDAKQRDLQELSGIADRRVGLVTLSAHKPTFAVAFSSAHDGGTARANGDGLLQIPETELPFGLVLTGLGWSTRPETDRLARRFTGRLFTERSLVDLVECIELAQ